MHNCSKKVVSSAVRCFVALLFACLVLFAGAGSARADTYHDYQTATANAGVAQRQGDYDTAIRDYLAALSEYPNADLPKKALIGMLSRGMPERLDLAALDAPANVTPPYTVSSFVIDRAPVLAPHATLVIPRPSVTLKDTPDPQYGWPFDHVVYVYRNDEIDPNHASLLCAVHYQVDDDQSLAKRIGSLLALLRDTYLQETGVHPAGDTHSFEVWLCRRAPDSGGGEEWRGNLYFYDTGDQRSSIEWIREIAHEYSHLAFPAIGGTYTQPEAWANGYIGERLLVRWLSRGALGGTASVERLWGTFSGYPNFDRILVAPAERLYEAHGPSDAWFDRRDAAGMRYVIGFLLWVDDTRGSHFLGNLLATVQARHEVSPEALYSTEVALAHHPKPAKTAATDPQSSA